MDREPRVGVDPEREPDPAKLPECGPTSVPLGRRAAEQPLDDARVRGGDPRCDRKRHLRLLRVFERDQYALAERVLDYQASPTATGAQRIGALVKLLTDQIVSWDVVDDSKNPVPLNEASLRRVPLRVLLRMSEVITGYDDDSPE